MDDVREVKNEKQTKRSDVGGKGKGKGKGKGSGGEGGRRKAIERGRGVKIEREYLLQQIYTFMHIF